MAIYHRKLLPQQDFNQTTISSDCGPNSPYNCDYVSITNNDNNDATTHISPCLIVIVALIASAILFISYYFIIIRYCARLRTPIVTTQVNEERDIMNQDQEGEIDHPIWYINTIGLQPAVINSIKVFKFKKGVGLVDGMDCSVCLSEFEDDEFLRLLPTCNHAFHIRCIDTWLRSHTNCPLCRAAVVFNNTNTILQTNDQHGNLEFGLNHDTEMENEDNAGLMLLDDIQECEIHEHGSETLEPKQNVETEIAIRRSFSAAQIVFTNSNLNNSSIELESLNHGGDSRTRRMMMMVRSFSYGGRSIM